ncbi:hypothetical protein C8Q75DRAFT_754676 [Abortiporus biennis]|nr:hypothetical protein C8Q75DRAFT_754676 [Abortiporus biennis]
MSNSNFARKRKSKALDFLDSLDMSFEGDVTEWLPPRGIPRPPAQTKARQTHTSSSHPVNPPPITSPILPSATRNKRVQAAPSATPIAGSSSNPIVLDLDDDNTNSRLTSTRPTQNTRQKEEKQRWTVNPAYPLVAMSEPQLLTEIDFDEPPKQQCRVQPEPTRKKTQVRSDIKPQIQMKTETKPKPDERRWTVNPSYPLVAMSEPRLLTDMDFDEPKLQRRSQQVPLPSQSQSQSQPVAGGSGRGRKKKDPNEPAPEKRLAIFKKQCPKNILERVERVISQRMFMISRRRNGDELREQFDVLGSQGNVYLVTIDKIPTCTCPDFLKGHHCKHILFIFLKVLQVTQASGYWYQKALITSELEDIFSHAPMAPQRMYMANTEVQNAHARLTGRAPPPAASSSNKRKRLEDAGDCAICYESFLEEGKGENKKAIEASLVWCDVQCGTPLHKECFKEWAKAKHGKPDCPTCRTPMANASTSAGGRRGQGAGSPGVREDEGYVNLGDLAGLSPERDTSSYYHGPRRGQRYYGYQDYF